MRLSHPTTHEDRHVITAAAVVWPPMTTPDIATPPREFPLYDGDNDGDDVFGYGCPEQGKGKGGKGCFKSGEAIDTANGEALKQCMFDHSNVISDNKNNAPVQRPLTVRRNRRKNLRLLESETADDDGRRSSHLDKSHLKKCITDDFDSDHDSDSEIENQHDL
jgi:hypothetical protein